VGEADRATRAIVQLTSRGSVRCSSCTTRSRECLHMDIVLANVASFRAEPGSEADGKAEGSADDESWMVQALQQLETSAPPPHARIPLQFTAPQTVPSLLIPRPVNCGCARDAEGKCDWKQCACGGSLQVVPVVQVLPSITIENKHVRFRCCRRLFMMSRLQRQRLCALSSALPAGM